MNTNDKETLSKKVVEGVKLLDENFPGWETYINLESLKLENTSQCILGQLYGDYSIGVSNLEVPMNIYYFGPKYGFSPLLNRTEEWECLTDLWTEVIFSRTET